MFELLCSVSGRVGCVLSTVAVFPSKVTFVVEVMQVPFLRTSERKNKLTPTSETLLPSVTVCCLLPPADLCYAPLPFASLCCLLLPPAAPCCVVTVCCPLLSPATLWCRMDGLNGNRCWCMWWAHILFSCNMTTSPERTGEALIFTQELSVRFRKAL